jgi:uncharacterized protein (DUF486 family)
MASSDFPTGRCGLWCWRVGVSPFFEYCFAVPANRIGHTVYSAAQLKTMQEIITLIVFGIFSVTYLNEAIRWNHMAAFSCLVLAGYFAFAKW